MVGILTIGQRTYAKYEAFAKPDTVKSASVQQAAQAKGGTVQPVSNPEKKNPLDGYEIRLLGTTLYKNSYHMHIELSKDGRKSVITESDLVARGYEWRMVSSCSVVLLYGGQETSIFCTVSDLANGKA